ncbi:MAG: phosphoribosylamine--glycine ligase [Cyanobacteria bacterium]|nr:phosphoribosylamine--glycine ligase [Cyanobacteriota bacterium]MDA1021173.1 phosphoribosylamine--glycine ligase [Cyanobacteriota bacterium]
MSKRLLVIGSGGREHALVWKLAQSTQVEKIFVAPGNPGTASIDKVVNVDIKVMDFGKLEHLAYKEAIDLTIVGPDDPLGEGIVDSFQAKGLKIWGPAQAAARLESSKAFAKDFMTRHNIPTAEYQVFTEMNPAMDYCNDKGYPIVIKASGLALGKGVAIAQNQKEAQDFLTKIFIARIFGDAGNEVVIEEFLEGQEISIHAFADGTNSLILQSAQDHKPVGEGNTGPNTGGMGTITPLPWLNQKQLNEINETVVKPTIAGMKAEGNPFVGLLYPGLIITKTGPKLLEYNVRFGDPETQVYMRTLETDLVDIIEASLVGKLDQIELKWSGQSAACIVLASGGYPADYVKGMEITGLDQANQEQDIVVFQAGTKHDEDKLVTNGGRVLGVTAIAADLETAISQAYKAAAKINFEGKYQRNDIGFNLTSLINCSISA